MQLTSVQLFVLAVVPLSAFTLAGTMKFDKRKIECLAVGAYATAVWKNAQGQKCTFDTIVGSNYYGA